MKRYTDSYLSVYMKLFNSAESVYKVTVTDNSNFPLWMSTLDLKRLNNKILQELDVSKSDNTIIKNKEYEYQAALVCNMIKQFTLDKTTAEQ